MDGPPTGGCPHIQTIMGIGTDGPTTDTVMGIIPMDTVDTLPMGTIADTRTLYTPAILAMEELAKQEMQDTVVQAAAVALEDTLGRL